MVAGSVRMAAGFLVCWSTLRLPARTFLHCGAILDGVGDVPRKEMTIVIEGDRIAALYPGYTPPARTDKVIDLKNATGLAGLMDMHLHLNRQQSPTSSSERLSLNAGDYALRAAFYAKKTLLAGFTTVRVLDDYYGSSLALRRAIN